MCSRWIFLVYILKINLKVVTSQHYNHHYYEPGSHCNDEEDLDDYEEVSEYRTRHKARHPSVKYDIKLEKSEECFCSCDECITRPKYCCDEFCRYCHLDTPSTDNDQNLYPNQFPDEFLNQNQEQKVVFVPYPYPLIVPNAMKSNGANSVENQTARQVTETDVTTKKQTEAATTTTTRTETETTTIKPLTTTEAPTPSKDELKVKSMEVNMLSRHRKMKQLNPAVKRNKPAWVSKYGIVPIPDHLTSKLMTHLTEVRALKARKHKSYGDELSLMRAFPRE